MLHRRFYDAARRAPPSHHWAWSFHTSTSRADLIEEQRSQTVPNIFSRDLLHPSEASTTRDQTVVVNKSPATIREDERRDVRHHTHQPSEEKPPPKAGADEHRHQQPVWHSVQDQHSFLDKIRRRDPAEWQRMVKMLGIRTLRREGKDQSRLSTSPSEETTAVPSTDKKPELANTAAWRRLQESPAVSTHQVPTKNMIVARRIPSKKGSPSSTSQSRLRIRRVHNTFESMTQNVQQEGSKEPTPVEGQITKEKAQSQAALVSSQTEVMSGRARAMRRLLQAHASPQSPKHQHLQPSPAKRETGEKVVKGSTKRAGRDSAATTTTTTTTATSEEASAGDAQKHQPSEDVLRPPHGTGMGKKDVQVQTLRAASLKLTVVQEQAQLTVPSLTRGLDRVLFNPGVFYFQDPRSRVFNFDPELQMITPVTNFNFDALHNYITSSEDTVLQSFAEAHTRKYFGSTSSMTSTLSHFHFLLSQWRPINLEAISQGFGAASGKFTRVNRLPSAIFLRWKNGTYGIDVDKQFDTANVLSLLGKSMEKLLTLSKDEYERYRKDSADPIAEGDTDDEGHEQDPQAFHYSSMGDFIMRSQLDAHDPRLPGTGMFDLKTRAVASIRMDVQRYEHGMGYEIRHRLGEWQSFEREYYDMMRAAFLKYSLQVRMGRMDGIFVAYHNIERIFGFQYISLAEMDSSLHGTWNRATGDNEFKVSIALLNEIFDRATARFPQQSIQFHFETREAETPFMYIFAEPHSEERVQAMQKENKAKVRQMERRLLGLDPDNADGDSTFHAGTVEEPWDQIQARVEQEVDNDEFSAEGPSAPPFVEDAEPAKVGPDQTATDAGTLSMGEWWKQLLAHGSVEPPPSSSSSSSASELDASKVPSSSDPGYGASIPDVAESVESTTAPDSTGSAEPDGRETELPLASAPEDSPTEMASGDAEHGRPAESTPSTIQAESPKLKRSKSSSKGKSKNAPEYPSSGELLAMTLTIRNKVNGIYQVRPENLSERDEWVVEYSLMEIDSPARAWTLYNSCRRRRRDLADDDDDDDDKKQQEVVSGYVRNLRKMSRQGRAWRQEQDAKDAKREPMVWDELPSSK